MSDSEEKIISLRIFMPEELKNEFKAVCARQGANMSEVVVKFVRGYIAEYGVTPSASPSPKKMPASAKTKANRGSTSKGASTRS